MQTIQNDPFAIHRVLEEPRSFGSRLFLATPEVGYSLRRTYALHTSLHLEENARMSDDPLDQKLRKLEAQEPNMMKGLQKKVNFGLIVVIIVLTFVQIALTLFRR